MVFCEKGERVRHTCGAARVAFRMVRRGLGSDSFAVICLASLEPLLVPYAFIFSSWSSRSGHAPLAFACEAQGCTAEAPCRFLHTNSL
jgi:hypothetical protein